MNSQNETMDIKLTPSWKQKLDSQFEQDYMKNLKSFLVSQYKAHKKIYPKGGEYFTALNTTPIDKVKVVILGQDPYHGEGQAHGLSFSVREGVRPPPSLVNIFKELKSDLGITIPPGRGDLTPWAQRGVLLLNSVLTVEADKAASHQKKGWEIFTDEIIKVINAERTGVAYVLWGSYAQKKAAFVDRKKNLVIESVHPSPLSAHRGFLGSKPFSKINNYLASQGEEPIDWHLN